MRSPFQTLLWIGALAVWSQCDSNTTNSCRLYASHYTRTDSSSGSTTTTDITCTFDRAALTSSCTLVPSSGGGASSSTGMTTWATLDAALATNHPVGKFTFSQSSTTSASCIFTHFVSYDDLGRPLSQIATASPTTSCGTYNLTYTAWEGAGRPTQATRSGGGAAANCVEQPVTWSYDDSARTVTFNAAAAAGCTESTTVSAYDANSLLVSSTVTSASGTQASTDTILSTDQICK
jgi:hypothetical protein